MTTTTSKKRAAKAAPAPEPIFRSAPEPSSGSNLTITWGLISIPAKVFTGTEAAALLKRSQFTPDEHPVGSMNYDKETGKPYSGPIVKKTVAADGTLVELTDEEMEAAIGQTVPAGLLEIESFVPADMIGREYVVEKQDQIRPAPRKVGTKNVPNEAADKAFALLLAAMAERGVAALVKMPRRGSYCYGAITSDGTFSYLLFADQVRKDRELPEPQHSEAELALGLQLIDSVGISTPSLEDVATQRVRDFVNAKAAGKAPKIEAKPVAEAEATIDLTAALAASLKVA